MSRLRYALLGLFVAGIAAVVAVGVLVHGRGSRPSDALPRGKVLSASADLFPQSVLFGQVVHVEVDAVVDHRVLDPSRVQLDASWAPYTPATPMAVTHTDVGNYTRLRWRVDLHCLDLGCAPRVGSAVRNVFQPTIVNYRGRVPGVGDPSVTVTWPTLIAWSRLDAIDPERAAVVRKTGTALTRQIAALTPQWHVSTALAPISYRIGPDVFFWSALCAALALLGVCALFLRPLLPAGTWRVRGGERSKLERALVAVEGARGRPVEERKALEALATELRETGEGRLAWAATELAWSQHSPQPEQTGALAESVRRDVIRRANGQHA